MIVTLGFLEKIEKPFRAKLTAKPPRLTWGARQGYTIKKECFNFMGL
jgi:hypothetical protein